MSNAVTLPCTDHCDPNCKGEQTFYLEIFDLTQEQIEVLELTEGNATLYLSHEQMESNQISVNDPSYCPEENAAKVDISLETICIFCAQ